jgi:hypothetical protein
MMQARAIAERGPDWLGRQDSNLGNGGIKIRLFHQRYQAAFRKMREIAVSINQ